MKNIDIDKISNRLEFGITNRANPKRSCKQNEKNMKNTNKQKNTQKYQKYTKTPKSTQKYQKVHKNAKSIGCIKYSQILKLMHLLLPFQHLVANI